MGAHSGQKIKLDRANIVYSYDTRNKAKGVFEGPPITNLAKKVSEGTQGSNVSSIPGRRRLKKLTRYKDNPTFINNGTSNWLDLKNSTFSGANAVSIPNGSTVFISLYVYPRRKNNRFNCQLNLTGVNTNLGVGGGSNTHDLAPYRWHRLWMKWANTTGAAVPLASVRIECYTAAEWSASKVNCYSCNYQIEIHTTGTINEPTPYSSIQTRAATGHRSPFRGRKESTNINYTTASYTTDGKNVFFDGTGETDGSPTGSYISIPSGDCTTNPSTRPGGATYVWWQYCKDLQSRSLFFGSGTINHIENRPPNFRTEAVLRNGHSFGASGANQVVNTWEFYAISFDNANVYDSTPKARWYKNGGNLFHTGNLTNANSQHDYFQPNAIGRATGSASYLYAKSHYGYFDCFYVYDKALDATEIQRIYNANAGYFNGRTMP